MRLFTIVLLIVLPSGILLGAFVQGTAFRTGFAVVTLVSGNVAGLIATETLKSQTASGTQTAVVGPSALVPSASILVPVGPVGQNTTAIAVANPSTGSGGINLVLTDSAGTVVLNTTVRLGPHQQFSKFLNEFFPTQPVTFTAPLLLTVSSEIPVATVAINFQNGDFAAVPLSSLSTPTPVPVQPVAAAPSVAPTMPPSGTAATGFGLGVAPPPMPVPTTSFPVTVTTSPVPATDSIGGNSALVFPQVVTGGGWSTEITLGNTSAGNQSVRIDFFRPDGAGTGSVTNIVIPARGVFFLSSNAVSAAGD